ncbi:o-succinylbenzoate synthase [Paenactinomyces guangxiensis]|uniref:o-succinylbenzoate synthase n=1 Tax=Paenactinomyces guangxiensis TaxID=1490290 RepID=A0A7W1WRD4_9BACL|nr:o-succinylbenzoate synthase [Paenactinomyces guangxiensis]MBA4494679.1 o-succinylbenzoate synthase [Paenactinomyces guangxiensis]MBH8591763.1 o-succinylbenzoate synthase [Paenactinomyces guangxiensis]
MKVEKIVLRKMKMKLKSPFQTSFGTEQERDFVLTEVYGDGEIGYGECVVSTAPLYSEETAGTAWHILEDFLIPMVFEQGTFGHPDEVGKLFAPIRRNHMAKSALEGAFWDLYAKRQNLSLAKALGGTKKRIEVGISIGIEEDINKLFRTVEHYLEQGYRRIKIKIKPGKDVQVLRALRDRFGDIPMMADANSAYTLNDLLLLKELDDLDLMMIEQPLAHDDIIDHAALQKQLKTPICLDESIHSYEDARKAIEWGSARIINIKIGRVGGLSEAKRIHDLCRDNGIPVWCGGMLESGIGRAHNIAITSLPNFKLPGDTAGSSRYWTEDIIRPEVEVSPDGMIEIPTTPGIGYQPVPEMLDKYTVAKKEFAKR